MTAIHETYPQPAYDGFSLPNWSPTRLIGRSRELGLLTAAFKDARYRRRGVMIVGAPGVGKTALVDQLRPLAREYSGWFIEGKYDPCHPDRPLGVVLRALDALGRLVEGKPWSLRERLRHALGPNAGRIAALLPSFRRLLGVAAETATGDPIEEGMRLRAAIVALLRTIASPDHPIVLVLDNLQWAPDVVMHLIDAILGDGEMRGLLLVGISRNAIRLESASPQVPRALWERMGTASWHMRLDNLSPDNLSVLIEDMLCLSPEAAAQLERPLRIQTGGNPYDAIERLRALGRTGVLTPNTEEYEALGRCIDAVSRGQARAAMQIAEPDLRTQELLESIACLGDSVPVALLEASSGLSGTALRQRLETLIEQGWLVRESGDAPVVLSGGVVRFRQDRFREEVYDALSRNPGRCCDRHLTIARRLASRAAFEDVTAEQYLAAVSIVNDPEERRQAVELFRVAAGQARLASNAATADRYLSAAMLLLNGEGGRDCTPLYLALAREQHAALYGLGRLPEADSLYNFLESRCADPVELVGAACVQMSSLINREQACSALELGLGLLERLGVQIPRKSDDKILRALPLDRWGTEASADELRRRSDVAPAWVRAASALLSKIITSAAICDPGLKARLILECQRLWREYGPCAPLVSALSMTPSITVPIRQDYESSGRAVCRAHAAGRAQGYEPEASRALLNRALSVTPWIEPLEESLAQAQRACAELLRYGDLKGAEAAYSIAITALLDCAPGLRACEAEIDAALAFAMRTNGDSAAAPFQTDRHLLRVLRGQTCMLGGFEDACFDENERSSRPVDIAQYHADRALAAVLFGDVKGLRTHSYAAMRQLPHILASYLAARVYLLRALSLAWQIRKAAPLEEYDCYLTELDQCRNWLAERARSAPENFDHLVRLVDAERAWALGDIWAANSAFDAALSGERLCRPWHRALIAERAGLFQWEQEDKRAGRMRMIEAWDRYAVWGALGKVRQLEGRYPFLRAIRGVSCPLSASIGRNAGTARRN